MFVIIDASLTSRALAVEQEAQLESDTIVFQGFERTFFYYVRREAYLGGKHGTKLVLYTVEGGGHTWPSGPQYLPPELIGLTSYQMNASEVIWSELRTHKNNQAKKYIK